MSQPYIPFKNGNYSGSSVQGRKIVGHDRSGPWGFIPLLNNGVEDFIYNIECGFHTPAAADATLTVTNSGTIGQAAGGLAIVSGATSGNNTTLQYIRSKTPVAAKRIAFVARLQLTNIALGQFFAGWWNAQADPKGTAPTDGFFISKDTAGTGVIKGNIAGNNTLAQTATITTLVNTTDVEFGMLYTPVDTTNGRADFWFRAADSEGWGAPTVSITAAAGVGPQAALRPAFNITASSSAALTATIPWYGFAFEL